MRPKLYDDPCSTGLTRYYRLTNDTCDLIIALLALDPSRRLSADDALDHPYFWTDPLPADPKKCVATLFILDGISLECFIAVCPSGMRPRSTIDGRKPSSSSKPVVHPRSITDPNNPKEVSTRMAVAAHSRPMEATVRVRDTTIKEEGSTADLTRAEAACLHLVWATAYHPELRHPTVVSNVLQQVSCHHCDTTVAVWRQSRVNLLASQHHLHLPPVFPIPPLEVLEVTRDHWFGAASSPNVRTHPAPPTTIVVMEVTGDDGTIILAPTVRAAEACRTTRGATFLRFVVYYTFWHVVIPFTVSLL